jgi:hypothetical protein
LTLEVLIIMAIQTSDAMPIKFNRKNSTSVSNGYVTSIFPLFWSEDADSSTFFRNIGVHLFSVTMTSPQYEQSLSITLLA